MSADLATLFDQFDRGRLSRRQLLKALGVAVAIRPASAFAQGQCGGARAGTPECDPTPAKLPFAATGWKTVLLDHLSCQVVDYSKEAAITPPLKWRDPSDDSKQATLDIGDWGGLVIRGGYQAPPPPGDRRRRAVEVAALHWAPQLRVRRFLLGIEPRDAKTVEAELRKRAGAGRCDATRAKTFRASTSGSDGFDLQISNGSRNSRRPALPETADVQRRPVRSDELEDRVARSHLVRGLELQGIRRVLHRAARVEAGDRRGQPEPMRDRRYRRHHHSPRRRRQSWRGTPDDAAGAPGGDGSHLIRHHAVRSRPRSRPSSRSAG